MKLVLTSLLFAVIGFQSVAHEGHQAFYRITEENGQLVLTVKLELPDVLTCLESEQLCSSSQEMKWCASTWVSSLVGIKLNGRSLDEQYESSFTESGHLVLRYSLEKTPQVLESIEIDNFCFLGSFDEYDNIIRVSLNGIDQGYKMSRTRTNIKIDFTQRS